MEGRTEKNQKNVRNERNAESKSNLKKERLICS